MIAQWWFAGPLIPAWASLAVIVALLATAVLASILRKGLGIRD